jgi:hypothetical protein
MFSPNVTYSRRRFLLKNGDQTQISTLRHTPSSEQCFPIRLEADFVPGGSTVAQSSIGNISRRAAARSELSEAMQTKPLLRLKVDQSCGGVVIHDHILFIGIMTSRSSYYISPQQRGPAIVLAMRPVQRNYARRNLFRDELWDLCVVERLNRAKPVDVPTSGRSSPVRKSGHALAKGAATLILRRNHFIIFGAWRFAFHDLYLEY